MNVPSFRIGAGLALAMLLGAMPLAGEEPAPSAEHESTSSILPDPKELFARTVYYSARRGANWLKSMQRPDGLFVYGWIPSLNRPMEGNNYLRQAGAAAALARSAAYTQDQAQGLAARQAILVLLSSYTAVHPEDKTIRQPSVAPSQANPVGFAALLLLAISELPQPTDALLEHGDGLAKFLASRQRPDGSINIADTLLLDDSPHDDLVGMNFYPGEALYALMRNHAIRPQQWKLDVVERAFNFYRDHWKQHPDPTFIPWQTAAFTEAYLWSKKQEYAAFVFEMNDWLLQFQYMEGSGTPAEWNGGFASLQDRHLVRTPPTAATGSYAEGMVEACRVARWIANECQQRVDNSTGEERTKHEESLKAAHARLVLYKQAAERSLQFLVRNQYTIKEASHFEHWYREKLNGAIYGGVEDGTVRIDFTQHAVCAMFHYLTHVADFDRTRFESNAIRTQAN